jgi:hypothetical protein
MRGKVGELKPPADTGDLEELIASEAVVAPRMVKGASGDASRQPGSAPIEVRLVEHHRPLVAADLGPNGDLVLDLLARASQLTVEECRRLEKEAAWRWGLVTPITGVTSMSVARAVALVRGRRDRRSEAIVALEAAVAAIVHGRSRRLTGSRLSSCISNAGLAVLVRDLIDSETFETLFGTWREVMHH